MTATPARVHPTILPVTDAGIHTKIRFMKPNPDSPTPATHTRIRIPLYVQVEPGKTTLSEMSEKIRKQLAA